MTGKEIASNPNLHWTSIDDMEQDLLNSYRSLHAGLSDMIEDGQLTEIDIPDDYEWLVNTLVVLAFKADKLDQALEGEGT